MSQLDTSKTEFLNQNLPFYINDYEELPSNFVCLKLNGNLIYNNIISADFSHTEQQLNEQFEKISNDLQNLSFFIKSSNLILSSKQTFKSLNQSVKTSEDLFKNYHSNQKLTDTVTDTPKQNIIKYVPVELLKSVTLKENKYENYSPLFTNHKGVCRLQTFEIPIDCLLFVDTTISIEKLYDIILDKLTLHLQAIKQCYFSYYQNENDFRAQTYYFIIDNQNSTNVVLTCVYPSNHTDDSLAQLRKDIHRILEFPTDKPLIRRVDSFNFKSHDSSSDSQFLNKLVNPHVSVKPSNLLNGKQTVVKGNYVYYHYMQDNFNDNGWGCAYRSFQTIFSWFKLQNLTRKPVPTHREIQQTLVSIGDKQKDFIGSSQWIGSMEISFCLSEMLNVDCKIISVSRGSELSEKARELQYHFETEGSPVMIGGGVLAHTIIGVDFNEQTGDVKYLILDPHYTGSEDIKTITTKGWVSWKDITFWKENSYYNLCCPIRPKGV